MMQTLSLLSLVGLYALLSLQGLYALIVMGWQVSVLRGKAMRNPDGTSDDWHEQRICYGIAIADLFLACPVTLVGVALVLMGSHWGHYALTMASFWFVWANTMTTATSLRFERPKITLSWFIAFPLGGIIGLAYMVWSLVHVSAIIGG